MKGTVVVDANLLLLLVVGIASRHDIPKHKRLQGYTAEDFDLLFLLVADYSSIALLPHTLAEVSSLARQIGNPARSRIQAALRTLILNGTEHPARSASGAVRAEFNDLGLTDAMLLHLCSLDIAGASPTLLTVDARLADSANALGYSVIDYKREFQP